jgi:hypothetical protein
MSKFPAAGASSSGMKSTAFASIDWGSALEDLAKRMAKLYARMEPPELRPVMMNAVKSIADDYRTIAQRNAATGNLAKSVQRKFIAYDYAASVIAGPKHTGSGSADEETGSGNHAWLIEFGTKERRPGGGNKKPALYVHKEVNGRMKGYGAMASEDFEEASSEYAFVMGTKNRPFINPGKHWGPYAVRPNQTYGAMPRLGWMQDTIMANRADVQRSLERGVGGILKTYDA